MPKRIDFVIPCYNEEDVLDETNYHLIKLVKELIENNTIANDSFVYYIDDGSKDKTWEKILGFAKLHYNVKGIKGQGAALQTGITYAIKQGANIIVTFDADGQHKATDIKRLIKPIQQDKADVFLGSRFLKNTTNAPLFRKIILRAGALSMRLFYGLKLTDSHNGFRAFSKEAAKKIKIKCDGMEHASEIIEQIADNNLRYKEIPNTITYNDYSMSKGQENSAALHIITKMIIGKLKR